MEKKEGMMNVKNLFFSVIGLVMLFYALQELTLTGNHMQTVFAMSWLCLAIFVIGGNFADYLYTPKRHVVKKQVQTSRRRFQRSELRQRAR